MEKKRPSLLFLELLLVSTNANTITPIYIAIEVALVVYRKLQYFIKTRHNQANLFNGNR